MPTTHPVTWKPGRSRESEAHRLRQAGYDGADGTVGGPLEVRTAAGDLVGTLGRTLSATTRFLALPVGPAGFMTSFTAEPPRFGKIEFPLMDWIGADGTVTRCLVVDSFEDAEPLLGLKDFVAAEPD